MSEVTEAIAKFTEAQKMDSYLQFDPVMKARILAIPKWLEEGRALAKQGDIPTATAKFQQVAEWGFQFGIKPEESAKPMATVDM